MKKVTGILLLSLFSLLLFSCADEHNEIKNDADSFYVEYGTVCGWCAGEAYIKVNADKVIYKRIIPCGENEGITTESRAISGEEWETLKSAFDYEKFLNLYYNTCNVCVDGCDEYIRIFENTDTLHEIRYTPGTEIAGIADFKNQLQDLLDEFGD